MQSFVTKSLLTEDIWLIENQKYDITLGCLRSLHAIHEKKQSKSTKATLILNSHATSYQNQFGTILENPLIVARWI